jgi:hypothetical protein
MDRWIDGSPNTQSFTFFPGAFAIHVGAMIIASSVML